MEYLSWLANKIPPAIRFTKEPSSSPKQSPPQPKTPSPKPKNRITPAQRIKSFEEALSAPVIDLDYIRYLCWQGIPDKPGLRQLCWKVLLGYLPTDKSKWEESLAKSRKLFAEFSQELIIDPRNAPSKKQCDHPLSLDQDSNWNAFFKDNELMHEIDKDVRRTFPHLHFFRGETEKHYEALRHILFIWAKLNPGIKYVQGMNEILAPIYYLFANDPDDSFRENSEADSFFCFTNIMSEIMNNFIKSLDRSEVGIVKQMEQMSNILKQKDHQLWSDLEAKNLQPQYYSFRWITLLLSQEFELPDVFRLWDTLFSDVFRYQFLLYVCCAMLIQIREKLLMGDFAENLKLLQQYPPTDMESLIALATELRDNPEWEAPVWEPPQSKSQDQQQPVMALDPQDPTIGPI